jgi:hypothetical protein
LFVGVNEQKTIFAQIRVAADVDDYYKLPLTQSQKVLITLSGSTNSPDLDLYLVRPGGGTHDNSNNIGTSSEGISELNIPAILAGDARIWIHTDNVATGSAYYTLTIQILP